MDKVENSCIEIWKPIPNYEEYMVSNYGRIKRLAYYKTVCGGAKQYKEEKIKKLQKRGSGYLYVLLCKNYKHKNFLVHRLVATAFILNPCNYPCVNHKDECKTNNFVFVNKDGTIDIEKSNLEWCTYKYNKNYGTATQRQVNAYLKTIASGKYIKRYSGKPVLDKLNNIIYPSMTKACQETSIYTSKMQKMLKKKDRFIYI